MRTADSRQNAPAAASRQLAAKIPAETHAQVLVASQLASTVQPQASVAHEHQLSSRRFSQDMRADDSAMMQLADEASHLLYARAEEGSTACARQQEEWEKEGEGRTNKPNTCHVRPLIYGRKMHRLTCALEVLEGAQIAYANYTR